MIAMNTWHHLTPSRATATVAEDGLDELVKSGALTPQTMVWTDGMADQGSVLGGLANLFEQ